MIYEKENRKNNPYYYSAAAFGGGSIICILSFISAYLMYSVLSRRFCLCGIGLLKQAGCTVC